MNRASILLVVMVTTCTKTIMGLQVVIPGGTGPYGKVLAEKLSQHDVTVLSRNAYLASAPARVTEVFGWLGESFLKNNPHVSIRDWDGGDLLDIVGQDWVGWQEDSLAKADVVVHLVGGYTEQRVMAAERLVRESHRVNRKALHVTVNPLSDDDLNVVSFGALAMKKGRIEKCEEMVQANLPNTECLRLEACRIEEGCDKIVAVIDSWEASGKE